MKKLNLFILFSFCFSIITWGQANFAAIDSLIKKELPQGSEVGISVYDLTARKTLYTYRDTKLSRPASTMKLLTTITALARPDADEPFRTEVWYKGTIEHDTLRGDIYVVGGFDPEFDDEGMNALVEEVITFPFSVLKGNIYGDISMKDSLYWGSGWAWDDTPSSFQPYLSPLMYHKGMVKVKAVVNGQGKLFNGMNIRVNVHRSLGEQLVVPKSSVVLRSGKQVIFTLKDNKAKWNYVQTVLENSDEYTIVEDEVQEGDVVIVTGNVNLAHEAPVKVIENKK